MSLAGSQILAAVLGGFVGGAMNSIAGGGTLVTFPLLIWLGLSPLVANATNMVALWPAAVSAAWGYRQDLLEHPLPLRGLSVASLLGGAGGAALLIATPPATFARLTPFLIWFATLLFMSQELKSKTVAAAHDPFGVARPGAWLAQGAISVYGGYFGAGVSIVMLAALRHAGVRDIHRANGIKNYLGACINFVAAAGFALWNLVDWPIAAIMAAAAGVGGYASARFARRLPRHAVRWVVIAIGLAIGAAMFGKTWN